LGLWSRTMEGLVSMGITKRGSVDHNFWSGKCVLVTGHTGFKGGWLTLWLNAMGARVIGFALEPDTNPSLFSLANIENALFKSYQADIRSLDSIKTVLNNENPEIVFHLAAQSLVRESYKNPVDTYSTNIMGTVNLLDSLRETSSVKASVIVSSDKCYENKEWLWGYRENDPMGGYDPYSSSKGCVELITSAFRQSFFNDDQYIEHGNGLATARAGNVIGGGDWSEDRLIPDAIRAFESNVDLILRNPNSKRPWQHVLEPISGYLMLAQELYRNGPSFSGAWNFGPSTEDSRPVNEVIRILEKHWIGNTSWREENNSRDFHETNLLALDCSKANQKLFWKPRWDIETAIKKTAEWYAAFKNRRNMNEFSLKQIAEYSQD